MPLISIDIIFAITGPIIGIKHSIADTILHAIFNTIVAINSTKDWLAWNLAYLEFGKKIYGKKNSIYVSANTTILSF